MSSAAQTDVASGARVGARRRHRGAGQAVGSAIAPCWASRAGFGRASEPSGVSQGSSERSVRTWRALRWDRRALGAVLAFLAALARRLGDCVGLGVIAGVAGRACRGVGDRGRALAILAPAAELALGNGGQSAKA